MLFISYVYDAPSCIFPKFADDLAGLVSVTVEESLQSVLSQLNSWSEEWELQLSTSKTKVMLFGSQQRKLNLALQGVKIEQVESMKYLGVWLDTHLTFLQQAEYAASKASKAYWKVNKLIDGRRGLTPKTGIELYKSLIRPCWEFSIAAWATTSEKRIN